MPTYRSKAKDSFNTRMRFFKFQHIVNKTDFTKDAFLNFNLSRNQDVIEIYTTQYFQLKQDKVLSKTKTKLKISEVYKAMKELPNNDIDWFEEYFKDFKSQYTEERFEADTGAKECFYCKITIDKIYELVDRKQLFKKNERGFRMEIDRKKPNLEYSNENCVPACYWCNNAKTDEFDDLEFQPIAREIKNIFDKRLKE